MQLSFAWREFLYFENKRNQVEATNLRTNQEIHLKSPGDDYHRVASPTDRKSWQFSDKSTPNGRGG